jgi:hypothetical protein
VVALLVPFIWKNDILASWMRDRVQPNRPNARIWCCFSSSKTLLIGGERNLRSPARVNVSAVVS